VASCHIVGGVEEHLTVGRVAELAGVTISTLHHYDEIGLLQPSARTVAGYRAYSVDDVERLRDVLAYRRLGFGLRSAYLATRRTEPRIAARIWDALGDAQTVLNVGAGTGSYEPPDRDVTAVEPSAVMRAQRPAGAAPCVAAGAEDLRSRTSRLTPPWRSAPYITGRTRSPGCVR
jgi:DNA-binding transcriptional MerR regulator